MMNEPVKMINYLSRTIELGLIKLRSEFSP